MHQSNRASRDIHNNTHSCWPIHWQMGAFPPNDDCPAMEGGGERSQEQKERDAILVVRGMAPTLSGPPQ